jgi:beta-lactam-binding protein with PASTA domain
VPNVLGLGLRKARQRLRASHLDGVVVRFADGPIGKVVSQSPPAGVAGALHMKVNLVVGRTG